MKARCMNLFQTCTWWTLLDHTILVLLLTNRKKDRNLDYLSSFLIKCFNFDKIYKKKLVMFS